MLFIVIFVELIHLAISNPKEVNGTCKEDGILKCYGIENASFTSVDWIKMPSSHIFRRSYNKTYTYKFNRTVKMTDSNSLLLPDLRPEDSGTYQCLIGAKVGQRNSEVEVILKVPDCVPERRSDELPLLWAGVCFLVLSILKCLMPLIVALTFSSCRHVKVHNDVRARQRHR